MTTRVLVAASSLGQMDEARRSLRVLAAEIASAHRAVEAAATSALEHARRAGELLIEAKDQLPHGEWLPWLESHCYLSLRVAQGYMRIAREWPRLIANTKRDSYLPVREALALLADPSGPASRIQHNSGEYEWYSPADYVELARVVMGGIDLDPASNAAANGVVQAATFYDIEVNGLEQPWHGRVWLNPPYRIDLITAFLNRLVQHYQHGEVTEAIVLTNNSTDTAWFHALAAAASAICFPRGRARYWQADTREVRPSSALQGQAVFYLGSRPDRFGAAFGVLGLIFPVRRRAGRWDEDAR